MKLMLLFVIGTILCYNTCYPPSSNAPAIQDTISFVRDIQPILVQRCSPCHFPGGKMYQRMPFDKDTTLIHHQSGILKRFKADENGIIRKFLEQKREGIK